MNGAAGPDAEAGLPIIVQGGMGVNVSGWRLARAVAQAGQLGVVSGVALDTTLARRLQRGDPGGHLRRALAHFPVPALADRVLDRFFVPGGLPDGHPFRPLHHIGLARLLDTLAGHAPASLSVTVDGACAGERHAVHIDPPSLLGTVPAPLARPRLLAIVSSASLVSYLARDPATRPDGFVLETPVAGGHSARPRGPLAVSEDGEPVYGPRDRLDLAKVRAARLPFWLAGGYATPRRLAVARAAGAAGVQVGTAFALCRESGLDPDLRQRLRAAAADGTLVVRNHADASPTGFPFKVVHLPGTVSEDDVYAARPRRCDLGYLRTPYRKPDGRVGYRCPAEPIDAFIRKGGSAGEAAGARCLCNGLVATTGLGQHRADGYVEPPLVTLGQDLAFLSALLPLGDYGAADVIAYLLGPDDSQS